MRQSSASAKSACRKCQAPLKTKQKLPLGRKQALPLDGQMARRPEAGHSGCEDREPAVELPSGQALPRDKTECAQPRVTRAVSPRVVAESLRRAQDLPHQSSGAVYGLLQNRGRSHSREPVAATERPLADIQFEER